MSLFEFLMVLVSIIIGLGIAEVLTGIAQQLRTRGSTQSYWVHSILVAVVFFALLQQWWEIWGLRLEPEWPFYGLVMMVSGPVGLFLIAHLLFPEPMQGANLREYYNGAMRPVWWLAALTVVLATLFRPLIFGSSLLSLDNATSFVLLFGIITLAISKRSVLHAFLVPAILLLVLLDIFQWTLVIASNEALEVTQQAR
jgi:hypothetical protein